MGVERVIEAEGGGEVMVGPEQYGEGGSMDR